MQQNVRNQQNRRRFLLCFGCLCVILILSMMFFPVKWNRPQVMTTDEIRRRLDEICLQEGLASGEVWQGGEESSSLSFALWLGSRLFGQKDPLREWKQMDTVPLAKAEGLRIGDILCTPGHAAVIYSISEAGEIRTIECMDTEDHLIFLGGFFLNEPENALFQDVVDRCGFECLLTAPNNESPVLWSGRMAALPEEPVITGATWPTVLSNGQSFGLRGTVSCKYPILEIRATVTNRVTDAVIFDVAVSPNECVYRIGSPVSEPINEGLVFNSPECANSWLNYKLTASYDREGVISSKVLLDQNFRVGKPVMESPDTDTH